jgi:protein-S-isoprenylcysteine O-methyltransferase Ste14
MVHFLVSAVVCFVCFAARSAFNTLEYRKSPISSSRAAYGVVFVVMLLLWGSWFHMCFSDPVRLVLPVWLRWLGLVLFLVGVGLFLFSSLKLHVSKKGESFARTGVYSRIRNPMYLGFIIWVVGFPVYKGSLVTLVCSAVWIAHFMYWKVLEERGLEREHEEYREYKKRTWF